MSDVRHRTYSTGGNETVELVDDLAAGEDEYGEMAGGMAGGEGAAGEEEGEMLSVSAYVSHVHVLATARPPTEASHSCLPIQTQCTRMYLSAPLCVFLVCVCMCVHTGYQPSPAPKPLIGPLLSAARHRCQHHTASHIQRQ